MHARGKWKYVPRFSLYEILSRQICLNGKWYFNLKSFIILSMNGNILTNCYIKIKKFSPWNNVCFIIILNSWSILLSTFEFKWLWVKQCFSQQSMTNLLFWDTFFYNVVFIYSYYSNNSRLHLQLFRLSISINLHDFDFVTCPQKRLTIKEEYSWISYFIS